MYKFNQLGKVFISEVFECWEADSFLFIEPNLAYYLVYIYNLNVEMG